MKDVSSLMDGELDARKARSTIKRVEDQDELWDAWATFHLIRDTLQGNPVVPGRLNQRLHERLLAEPVPAPVPWWRRAGRSRTLRVGTLLLAALLLGWIAYWQLSPPARGPSDSLSAAAGPDPLQQPRVGERVSAHRPMMPPDSGEEPPRASEARP